MMSLNKCSARLTSSFCNLLIRRFLSVDPQKLYHNLVQSKKIVDDPIQKKAVELLQMLYTELTISKSM